MMLCFCLFLAVLAGNASLASELQGTPAECLNAAEKKRLSEQRNLEGRIKVYRDISERYHQAALTAASKKKFDAFSSLIACWKENLESSSKDIDANANRKKKSGALIKYEIQLRKSIVDMNSARLKAPADTQDAFESWIDLANKAHNKFVDILFQR